MVDRNKEYIQHIYIYNPYARTVAKSVVSVNFTVVWQRHTAFVHAIYMQIRSPLICRMKDGSALNVAAAVAVAGLTVLLEEQQRGSCSVSSWSVCVPVYSLKFQASNGETT